MRSPGTTRKRVGFTVVEMLVALAITMVIGLATLTLQKDIFSVNTVLSDSLTAQTQLRNVLRTATTRLRMAATANDGAYPISEADAVHVIFFSDIDHDGLRERVRYYMDGTTLKCGVVKPSGDPLTYNLATEVVSSVVNNVANGTAVFSYYDNTYDGTGAALTAPIDIPIVRMVRVTLSVDRWTARVPDPISFNSAVTLRNLKVNP
ncbi:MAG: type II secretion system protein [Patescibacteria group bacterium]|nr:type II secretion system protein [Patescibacteria group bacterium]